MGRGITPLTYMNSTAAIKAFCGERGGLVCTSSNAPAAFKWAFARNEKILFLPDQHLGRNTAFAMGIPLNQWWSGTRYMIGGGVDAGAITQGESDSVEGTLLGAPALSAGACGSTCARNILASK